MKEHMKTTGALALALLLSSWAVAQEPPAPPKPPKPATPPRRVMEPVMPALPVMPVLPELPALHELKGIEGLSFVFEDMDSLTSSLSYVSESLSGLSYSLEGPASWQDRDEDRARERAERERELAEREQKREQERAERELERAEREKDRQDRRYESAKRHLDRGRYERAAEEFARVAEAGGRRAEGALYWKAYSEYKSGSGDDALTTIQTLRSSHPQSKWLNDAQALEAEIQQRAGQPVDPEAASDEEMIESALRALLQVECGRAVPVLEKFLQGTRPPRLKERALFVLAQKDCSQARQLLATMAKGGSNPDLQMKAIQYLGIHGGQSNRGLLAEIYESSGDTAIRRRILQSFMVAGDKERLLAAARTETNEELRGTAVQQLGIIGAHTELRELYQAESSLKVKKKILQGMFIGSDVDGLMEVAKNETEQELRLRAVRNLGLCGGKKAGGFLLTLYDTEPDIAVRKKVLEGLFLQGDDKALIEIARKEKDPALKKEAIKRLSLINSDAATEFFMEILNQ